MYSKKSPRVMKPWMGLPKSLNVIQPGQTSANLPITASRQHSYRPLADGTLVLLAEVGHKPPPIPLEEIQLPLEQTPFNPGSVIGKRPWIEHHRDDDEEVAEDGHSVKRARIIFDDGDDDDDDDDTDEEEVEDEDKDADGEEDEDADGEEDEDANANAGGEDEDEESDDDDDGDDSWATRENILFTNPLL